MGAGHISLPQFFETYAAIIAVTIAVLGWLATHWLSLKANEKAFRNQITNDARLQVTRAIRDYQDWLSAVLAFVGGLPNREQALAILQVPYQKTLYWERLSELRLDPRAFAWAQQLEEHEILFAQTRQCRIDLLAIERRLEEGLEHLVQGLVGTPEERLSSVDSVQQYHAVVSDQLALTYDLAVHLQNYCLSALTGRVVPERAPLEPTHPHLATDRNGDLQIRRDQNSTGAMV